MVNVYDELPKPFLRWAGGKSKLIPFLKDFIPPNFSNSNRYYEPFLGAGSMFFYLKPKKATISDNNKELIECYKAVKKRPELIHKYLKIHLSKTNQEYYYKMRAKYNSSSGSIAKAALFIYLNKTCFNGIWRVNNKGEFNVPYGFKEPPALPSKDDLFEVSKSLSRIRIHHAPYKTAVNKMDKGDFVYFDPPYPPLNGTSYFTHYTKKRFNLIDHAKLATLAVELKEKGCYVLISNADTTYIRKLYKEKGFKINPLKVTRWISANGKRFKANEIAIANYIP
jgi:DNA adenine methylase